MTDTNHGSPSKLISYFAVYDSVAHFTPYTEAGVRLAMGTDSLSSSPSLNIWEEAASALRIHRAAGIDLDPHDMLRICTLDGAHALGFDFLLGSLEPGKLARLAVGKRDLMGKDDDIPTTRGCGDRPHQRGSSHRYF